MLSDGWNLHPVGQFVQKWQAFENNNSKLKLSENQDWEVAMSFQLFLISEQIKLQICDTTHFQEFSSTLYK